MKVPEHRATRYLRRAANGYATLNKPPKTKKSPELCDICCIGDSCKVTSLVKKMKTIKIKVGECQLMIPPIVFIDPSGTEAKFNTIRLGGAWAGRLSIGQTVGLVRAKDSEVYGFARVVGVDVCDLDEVIGDHAHKNHTVLHLPREQARSSIAKTLPKIYGAYITPDAVFSVIYLERADGALGEDGEERALIVS